MGKVFEGSLIGTGLKFAIVAARFNNFIGKELVAGAEDTLVRSGVSAENIDLAWVPGAFEIPQIAKKLAVSGRYDGIICVGVVIRGSTSHYDYVAGFSASGIASISAETGVPILLGIVTTESIEQAIERAGTKAGNYGTAAARAAIEMATLNKMLDEA